MADETSAALVAAQGGRALGTLPGAIETAGRLPAHEATGLLDSAREAFTRGLHVNATIAVAFMVGLAVLALALLRDTDPDPDPSEDPAHSS